MRNPTGLSILALALVTPVALANDNENELARVRVPALQGGTSVNWTLGKGISFTNGDNKAVLGAWAKQEYRYVGGDVAINSSDFRIREGRIGFNVSVGEDTKVVLWIDSGNAVSVKDAWVQQKIWANDQMRIDARFGQQKPMFGREGTGSTTKRLFPEVSVSGGTFSSSKRTRGINGILAAMDNQLHVWVGAHNITVAGGTNFTGNGEDAANPDKELNYQIGFSYDSDNKGGMSRLGYAQGDLARSEELRWSVGGGLWIENESTGVAAQGMIFNLNAAVKSNGFSGMVDFYLRSAEIDGTSSADASATGITVQGTYLFEGNWVAGARYSWVNIDDDTGVNSAISLTTPSYGGTSLSANGDATEITIMGGKLLNGHAHKVLADFTFQSVDPDSGTSFDNIIFRVQHFIRL